MKFASRLTEKQREDLSPWLVFSGMVAVLIAAYFNTLSRVASGWNEPQYSHGYLVPLFAMVLIWLRREPIGAVTAAARWTGVGVVCASLLLWIGVSYVPYATIDNVSMLPCLAGFLLIVGGWRMLRWAGPAVVFLIFMYPLPMVLSRNVLEPLQKIATVCSTYMMQTLGIEAFREGNIISLAVTKMNVIDACSGLRMATIFLALAAAIALVTVRPWWERVIILLSAIPVAIAVNVIRITLTGIAYTVQPEGVHWIEKLSHDLAGLFMMPMALGFLYLECVLLSRVFVEEEATAPPKPVGVSGPASFGRV